MGRKNRRDEWDVPLDLPSLADIREEALSWREVFDQERKLHAQLGILSQKEQTFVWNEKRRRKRGDSSDRAIRATLVCQMPKCERDVIRLGGESLGICQQHAMRISDYFQVIAIEFNEKMRRIDQIERHRLKKDREERRRKREAEQRRTSPGWIYYILVGDRIKIGYSVDVRRRLRAYPPDTPLLAMHEGNKQDEHDLHVMFASSRVAGREWFLDTPEIREHITKMVNAHGEPDRARYEHRGQRRDRGNLSA